MRRNLTIIGILAILLTAANTGNAPVYHRVVSSVHSFQHSFGDLRKVETMNSIERFVFSLVLSHYKAPATASNQTETVGRT